MTDTKTAEERVYALFEELGFYITVGTTEGEVKELLLKYLKAHAAEARREPRLVNCPACSGLTPYSKDAFFVRGNDTYEHFGRGAADSTYTCNSGVIRALIEQLGESDHE